MSPLDRTFVTSSGLVYITPGEDSDAGDAPDGDIDTEGDRVLFFARSLKRSGPYGMFVTFTPSIIKFVIRWVFQWRIVVSIFRNKRLSPHEIVFNITLGVLRDAFLVSRNGYRGMIKVQLCSVLRAWV